MKRLIEKFNSASPAVKASTALLFANLVLKGLSMISGPIFTRIMSTEQYGLVSNFSSWRDLLSVVVTFNLSSGVFNNGMLDFKDDRDSFQFSLTVITILSTLVYTIIFSLFSNQISGWLDLPKSLVYLMLLYFAVVPAYQFWSGRQRYEFKYKALTVITILSAIISMILGIVAVLVAPESKDAVAKVYAAESVGICIGIFFVCYFCLKTKLKINFEYCKYALRFNIPLIPHYLSMYVLSSSDRIMITKMVSLSATAIYSVAYTVASIMNILWQSIDASLAPWIYEKLDHNDTESVKNITSKILLLFALSCVSCTLFAPEIMTILAPESYSEGIYVIPPVAAGVFFTAMYSLYMRVELFYKQSGFAALATGSAAALNIILNYIFIKLFGAVAAGYTTMVCYAFLAALHYFNIKKKGHDCIFNNGKFLYYSIAVIIASVGISLLYDYTVVRYTIIFVVCIIAYIKRKEIFRLIKIR